MADKKIAWTKLPLPRRRFLQGASALAAAGVAGGAVPRLGWSAEGGTLRSRTYADMRSLDPAFSQGVVDEEIQGPIYSKLIQYKPGPEWGLAARRGGVDRPTRSDAHQFRPS